MLQHAAHALRLLQAEERRARHATGLKRLEDEHADDLKNLEAARSQATGVEKLLGEVRFEIQKDPEGGKLDQLDRQKREMEESVKALREARKSARQRLDERHYRWVQWLKHGASLPLDGLREVLVVDDVLLTRLRSGTDAERLEAMAKLAGRFNDLWNCMRDLMRSVQDGIKTAQSRLQQLAEDLENLSKGQAPGSFPLFHAIRQKLGSRAEQLARLIEVKPEAERWWPALELFLGRHRWVVVVDEGADYRSALDILSRTPPGREGESLLNPVETRQLRGGARGGSLFEKVEVAHPIAHYVEHLFGDVRCVEPLEELETAEAGRAITPDGIYFGDLDPQGVLIPQEASARASALCLPAVEAHLWSYRTLLAMGETRAQTWTGDLPPSALCDWLQECSGQAWQLFANGRRLAQEHIGWDCVCMLSGRD